VTKPLNLTSSEDPHTQTIIPYNSCHPAEHKYATWGYLANRVNTYQLSPAARDVEIITIQNILYNNGFPLHHIDKSMTKQNNQNQNPHVNKRMTKNG
jgi:hypothetical protein